VGLSPTRKKMSTISIIDDHIPVRSSELTAEWLELQMDGWVDLLLDDAEDVLEVNEEGGVDIKTSVDIDLRVLDDEPLGKEDEGYEVWITLSASYQGSVDLEMDIWHDLPADHPAIDVLESFDYRRYEPYLKRCFRKIEETACLPSDLEQFGRHD
jgi:hypothetical protein